MNSYTIQILGQAEIPQSLELGKTYEIKLTSDCVAITKTDEQDGTFTFKHKLKGLAGEILGEKGTVKTIDKKHQSQKLRGQLWAIANQAGVNEEEFYEQTMIKIRHYLPEILALIKTLEK